MSTGISAARCFLGLALFLLLPKGEGFIAPRAQDSNIRTLSVLTSCHGILRSSNRARSECCTRSGLLLQFVPAPFERKLLFKPSSSSSAQSKHQRSNCMGSLQLHAMKRSDVLHVASNSMRVCTSSFRTSVSSAISRLRRASVDSATLLHARMCRAGPSRRAQPLDVQALFGDSQYHGVSRSSFLRAGSARGLEEGVGEGRDPGEVLVVRCLEDEGEKLLQVKTVEDLMFGFMSFESLSNSIEMVSMFDPANSPHSRQMSSCSFAHERLCAVRGAVRPRNVRLKERCEHCG